MIWKESFLPCIVSLSINIIMSKLVWSRWPMLVSFSFSVLWILTLSQSVNMQTKTLQLVNIQPYYMASSASRQDEPNRALRLATWAGKVEPCPLGTTCCIRLAKFHQKPYNKSFIDQLCSVKMAGYWPCSFFCAFMDLDFVSVHKRAKKELGQYPAILPSHLVSNPYILTSVLVK